MRTRTHALSSAVSGESKATALPFSKRCGHNLVPASGSAPEPGPFYQEPWPDTTPCHQTHTHTHSFPAQEWRQHLAGQQEPLSTGVHRDHTYKCTCHPKSPHLLPTIANAKSSRSNRRTWQPCVWPFIVLMYPLNGDICVLLQKR